MTKSWWGPLVVGLLTLAGVGLVLRAPAPEPSVPDVVAAHDLRVAVEASWPAMTERFDELSAPFAQVTLKGADGEVLAATGEPLTDDLAALRAGASGLTVEHRGADVATIWLTSPDVSATTWDTHKRVAAGAVGVVGAVAAAILLWQRQRVLVPFARLQTFAADVAAGVLVGAGVAAATLGTMISSILHATGILRFDAFVPWLQVAGVALGIIAIAAALMVLLARSTRRITAKDLLTE